MPQPVAKRRSADPARLAAARQRQTLIGILAMVVVLALGAVYWIVGGGRSPHDGAPTWSPDSRSIAFAFEHDDQSDLYVMNADGTDRRQLTDTRFQETSPAWAPDGRRIAFESDRDGNFELYVMNQDGGRATRLTSNRAADHAPAWSPDGKRIAFISTRSGASNSDVYVMNADGSGVRKLTNGGQYWSPQFGPGGREIAVQGGRDVYLINADSGARRRLTFDPQNGMSPTWAPDGQRIAFASTRRARLELFTTEIDGANPTVVLSMPGGSVLDPRWSPDGSRIAFVYVPQGNTEAPDHAQAYAIYVLDVSTRKVARLSP